MAGRVLFVTGEYPPLRGGVGDYTWQLGCALAAAGWTVEVATRRLPGPAPEGPLVCWQLAGWGRPLWSLLRSLRESGWHGVVHLQYQAGAFDLQGRIVLLPVLARPLPVVTTFHDLRVPYLFPKASLLRRASLRILARTSARVVTTNREDEWELRRWGVRPERLVRIPIGSNLPEPRDPTAVRAGLGLPGGRALVAFFGFRHPEKGLETLLVALDALPEPRPVLLLIGGAQPDVHGARDMGARSLGVSGPVPIVDLGYRPAQEVADLLAAVDVVVLPFRHGASLRNGTLIAALACGAAVISTQPRDPTALAPLRDGEHLRLVPPDNPRALAQALSELLSDAVVRERLRRAARDIARSFSWHDIAAAHDALYRTLLPEGR